LGIGLVRGHPKVPADGQKMMSREHDLKELASCLSAAIAKARALNLPTSAYILSMAMVEVSRALEVADADDENAPR
jgi:hypothetical protein